METDRRHGVCVAGVADDWVITSHAHAPLFSQWVFLFYVHQKGIYEYLSRRGGGGENRNLLCLDGRIWWKKCGCLFPFPLPYLIYGDLWREEPIPFARGTWDCVREALQTPLLKISFVNKHLWAWRKTPMFPFFLLRRRTQLQITGQWDKTF